MRSLSSTSFYSCPNISGYSIVEQLYLGSRTAVYRAIQTAAQRSVVIKVLQSEYPTFSELVQFRNQYAITKNLTIPGIIQPLQLESVGSRYALVMEDWGGVALDQFVQTRSLDLTEILAIALQLADILHALAQHRIIHKDIKPANILIHPESKQIKLIDFSIASLLPKESQEIQNLNGLEGTLAYLAPEQTGRMNRGIDYRVDFYTLGVTLYQLLTGTLPFTATDPLELIHCHIAKTPPSIADIKPDVPTMVAAIATKLMAKNAENRYQSAIGLKHDLEQCLTQWKEAGSIRPFALGQQDLSDRFLIPEKLYGRESEVETLLAAFERVADGSSELMLVAGFSGIGKTAVVNEVHKPIVRQRGYFSKGKFDQFNRNIPLSAFVQALRDLMGQLLSETDDQVQAWKTKILSAIGENGQVLIEVIPELEQVIGKQPAAPELSGNAAQNRFNLLFQKFIEVFTTAAHPLVLFLDDLQWADLASLQLLKLLMDDNGYLLMLGAYRDNEVSAAHPFTLMVEDLKKAAITVQTITLKPLAFADTNRLIAETLNCTIELAQPLSELIDRKTQGNPFFTTQFLKALHEGGQISFNRDRGYWQCDIAQVNALALTDDVVQFMALQLQKLPVETQQVLKLAACIGNQFDLETLAIVSERSPIEAATDLWKALPEELILPISQIYKFFQSDEQTDIQSTDIQNTDIQNTDIQNTGAQNAVNPTYRFLHDRVQQAAYSLIPEDQQQQTHLKIGRLLLGNQSDAEYLFGILNHFNTSIDLICDPEEKRTISQLNLRGYQRAKGSTAYHSAFQYANTAVDLLPPDVWQIDYDLALEIYQAAAEAAYLQTEFSAAKATIQTILNNAKCPLDCTKSHELLIQIYIANDEQLKAIHTGLEALIKLGVPLIERGDWQENLPQLPDASDLAGQTTMTQPEYLAALQILIAITPPTHHVKPEIFPAIVLTMVDLCKRAGFSRLAAYVYGIYGLFLCAVIGDLEAAHRSGQVSLALLQQYPGSGLLTKVNMLFAAFVCACKEPGQSTLPLLKQAIEGGLEEGDIEHVSYCIMAYFTHLFLVGQPLESIEVSRQSYLPILEQFKQEHCIEYSKIWLRVTGEFVGVPLVEDPIATEADALSQFETSHNHQCLFAFHLAKLIACYAFGHHTQAVEHGLHALESQEAAFGVLLTSAHTFYYSLALLASLTSLTPVEWEAELEKVFENQTKLQHLADHAPDNYQHKCELVAAEIHRVQGQHSGAIALYDCAIAGAKTNGYIQEAALANELAAQFYLNWGKEKVAAGYMQEAYYGYAQWGAVAKIQDLVNRYPHLLAPILQQQRIALSATETLFSPMFIAASQTNIQASTSSSTSISAHLDLATVLKASQTLSREIQLDKLLANLMTIVVEAAGADKAALILRHSQTLEVGVTYFDGKVHDTDPLPLSQTTHLPISVVQSVNRTEKLVILNSVSRDYFAHDPYLKTYQPASVLAAPIFSRGAVIAILYVENSLTARAFTSDRIELLNTICVQAAISLENARLYQQSQAYVQQLEQSHLQVVQSEKMASLGNLVAGVAHEINNPLGFLNGSIKNAKDYVQDLFSHLALYQQHYPDPIALIQDDAEDIDLEFLNEDLPHLLETMKGATDRIKGISTSLRTFSRADTEYKIKANLNEGIDSTILILKYRLKANECRPAIKVIQDYGDLSEIDCFPGQLNQVFMNILANAIDMFDDMAQQIAFAELQAHPQTITIQTRLANPNTLEICLRDNGRGMPAAVKSRIFDHLFTTKAVGKGTGLGLAIARQIVVEKHGGSLEVRTEPGQGTEFCIRLPIAA